MERVERSYKNLSYRRYTRYDHVYARLKKLDWIVDHVTKKFPEGGRVLDFGCGTGNIAIPLASLGYNVIGLDCDTKSIEQAINQNHFPNAVFLVINPKDPKFDGLFDIIICSEVLEHVDSPPLLVMSFKSHLKPEGLLLISIPNGYGPWELVRYMRYILVAFLDRIRIGNILRRIRYLFRKNSDFLYNNECQSTLNPTEHRHRFTLGGIYKLLENSGFRVTEIGHSDFISGIEFVRAIFPLSKDILFTLDQKIANWLPSSIVSGWYLACIKEEYK